MLSNFLKAIPFCTKKTRYIKELATSSKIVTAIPSHFRKSFGVVSPPFRFCHIAGLLLMFHHTTLLYKCNSSGSGQSFSCSSSPSLHRQDVVAQMPQTHDSKTDSSFIPTPFPELQLCQHSGFTVSIC